MKGNRDSGGVILLYDGECGLCQALAEWVRERDRHQKIHLLSYQDPERPRRLPGLDPAKLAKEIHLVHADGELAIGAAAFAEILRRLPRYGWIGRLLGGPLFRGAAKRLYHYIARYRYQLNRH